MTAALTLSRHELLWVLEQCDAEWPYPLAPVYWDAETVAESERHRRAAEEGLAGRGLLAREPAAALLEAGETAATWTVAVDLLHRSAAAPRAAVGLLAPGAHGPRAALLCSADHSDAPVAVELPDAGDLAAALVATVPPAPAGAGPTLVVPPSAPGTGAAPETRRRGLARAEVAELVDGATGWTLLGVATRPDPRSAPRRHPERVSWIDGPRGRHLMTHRPEHAALTPRGDAQLAADIHTVLADAAGSLLPHRSGRSTA